MLVAPTEPPALRAIGRTSMASERWGCDLAFTCRGGWYGIQRKEFADLIASMGDGRLGEQIAKMDGLAQGLVVIEGLRHARWAADGALITGHGHGGRITRSSIEALLWSVRARGVWVDHTDDLAHTIRFVQSYERWVRKGEHRSLDQRPGPVTTWAKPTNRDWQRHMLQGLPGVGVELADRIIDKVGMPIGLKVTREELLAVEGVGPKKVDAIAACLGGGVMSDG